MATSTWGGRGQGGDRGGQALAFSLHRRQHDTGKPFYSYFRGFKPHAHSFKGRRLPSLGCPEPLSAPEVFEAFWPFSPLMRLLKENAFPQYVAVQRKYATAMQPVYRKV